MKLFKREVHEETFAEKRQKIINDQSEFGVREAYKALRTNIMFSIPKKPCKRIIVTSPMMSDGKSTNSVNIAISFAETGSRVLLIDCDLRRPNVANLLELGQPKGLSNILAGYNTFEEVVVSGVRNSLDVLAAGEIPPNPTELLGSAEFTDLLDKLSQSYEYMILDTSPVNMVTDTVLLSGEVDGIVLVVRCNKTEKDDIASAMSSLEMVKAKVLGFVLNDVEADNKGHYGRYGKYKQAYELPREKAK